MASLASDKSGNRRIQFIDRDDNRRSIALGNIDKKSALYIRTQVEELVSASITGHSLKRETSSWLADVGDVLKQKLAKVGLIDLPNAATLERFIASYLETRTDLKTATWNHLRRCGDSLIEFLGNKPLREVTEGDVNRWRLSLIEKGLVENTVRRMCGRAKQFFTAAIEDRLLDRNPFTKKIKTTVGANDERFVDVSRETVQKVIDVAPCAEWRLLIALARYGGLRTPSEPLKLRWSDIDWENQRIRVPSPKTEHHEGKASRIIPLFPELRQYLNEVWDSLGDKSAEFVINRFRDASMNLRTHLTRLMERAGVEPWGKPWQNLRISRQTELAKKYPLHVVCAWMGNSQPVAKKHYLKVTDDDYRQAIANPASEGGAESVQSQAAEGRKGPQTAKLPIPQRDTVQEFAKPCERLLVNKITPHGFEP